MKKLDFPNRITVELTNQCNVSCTFCPRQSVKMDIGFMDEELFHKIVDEAAEHLPVAIVFFFRGESLLHPSFFSFLKYAKDKGIGPIQFATNAYAMDHSIADQLVESGIDFISFSLDTLDPEIYKRSRLAGDLNVSMDHVVYMSELCKARRKKGLSSPELQVSTIETRDYIGGQSEFVDYWKKYADIVRVYYEHDDQGRFRNPETQKKVEELVPERKPCRKVFTDMLIYWDGQLALCCYDWRAGVRGINVREMTLQQAWDSEEYEMIREMHNSGDFRDDLLCKGCQHWRIDYMPEKYLGKSFKGNEDESK